MIILFTGISSLKELPNVSTPNLMKLCPTHTTPVNLANTKLSPKITFEPSLIAGVFANFTNKIGKITEKLEDVDKAKSQGVSQH